MSLLATNNESALQYWHETAEYWLVNIPADTLFDQGLSFVCLIFPIESIFIIIIIINVVFLIFQAQKNLLFVLFRPFL